MRKILCILLSLITVLPIMISTKNAAHAEEDEYTVHWIYDIQSEPLSYDNGYVYSGTMVSGVTWNFDIDSGTLSVTGNGEIDDYTSPDVSGNNEGKAPWIS